MDSSFYYYHSDGWGTHWMRIVWSFGGFDRSKTNLFYGYICDNCIKYWRLFLTYVGSVCCYEILHRNWNRLLPNCTIQHHEWIHDVEMAAGCSNHAILGITFLAFCTCCMGLSWLAENSFSDSRYRSSVYAYLVVSGIMINHFHAGCNCQYHECSFFSEV